MSTLCKLLTVCSVKLPVQLCSGDVQVKHHLWVSSSHCKLSIKLVQPWKCWNQQKYVNISKKERKISTVSQWLMKKCQSIVRAKAHFHDLFICIVLSTHVLRTLLMHVSMLYRLNRCFGAVTISCLNLYGTLSWWCSGYGAQLLVRWSRVRSRLLQSHFDVRQNARGPCTVQC